MFNVNANQQQSTENNVNNLSAIEDESLRQGHSQFHVHKLVEQFCRNTHLLKLIEGCVQEFVTQYQQTGRAEDLLAPLKLRLDIVVRELATRAPQLLKLLIREPLQFGEAVKYATFGLVRDQLRLLGQKPVDIGQLHAHWRVVGLQFHPNLLFDPGRHLYPLGLSFVQGILSAYTPPETLVLQTIWFCGSGCLRNALQTSSTDAPLCSNCSRPMSEYQKLRVTERYRLLAILSLSSVQTPREIAVSVHRAIIVRARGMPPKKSVGGRPRRRNPIHLNDFLNGTEETLADEEQQQKQHIEVAGEHHNQQNQGKKKQTRSQSQNQQNDEQHQSQHQGNKKQSRPQSQTQIKSNDLITSTEKTESSPQLIIELDNTNGDNANAFDASSISCLSSVTPVMTSSSSSNLQLQSQDDLNGFIASAPAGNCLTKWTPANVWNANSGGVEPKSTAYAPDMEDFPVIGGQRPKKSKATENNRLDGVEPATSTDAANLPTQVVQRPRGRGRHISVPVLGNFLPSAVPPTTNNTKQLEVGEWLKSVREMSQANKEQVNSKKKQEQEPPMADQVNDTSPIVNRREKSVGGKSSFHGNEMGRCQSESKIQSLNYPVISTVHKTASSSRPGSSSNKQQQNKIPLPCGDTTNSDPPPLASTSSDCVQNAVLNRKKRRNRRCQRNWNPTSSNQAVQDEVIIDRERQQPTVLKLARPERLVRVGPEKGYSFSISVTTVNSTTRDNGNQEMAYCRQQIEEKASRSQLNSNAMEFHPTLNRPEHISQSQKEEPMPIPKSKLGERRSRQRFTRSLRPDTLFELVSPGLLPTPDMPSSNFLIDSLASPAPAVINLPDPTIDSYQSSLNYFVNPIPSIAPAPAPTMDFQPQPELQSQSPLRALQSNTNFNWSSPHLSVPIQYHNSNASQSVFRLASLPSTGVGTIQEERSPRIVATIPQMVEMSVEDYMNSGNRRQSNSSSHNPSYSSRLPSTISFPSSLTTNITQYQVPTLHQDLQYTHQLLNMDQTMTVVGEREQETQFILNATNEHGGIIDVEQDTNTNIKETNDNNESIVQSLSNISILQSGHHPIFSRESTKSANSNLRLIPKSLLNLYQLICANNSDYAFVYALSAQLSQKIVPMECFVYLKMALLASLASIDKDELRQPIALCIISSDNTLINLLMTDIGQLAPRFIGPHEGGQQPVFNALSTRYNWIMASPLLMAQRGVYYAGDWTRLTREQSDELQKSIENGVVPIPQINGEQQLEAAIWTYWQPEHSTNQSTIFTNFCPIFGLPIYMGDQSGKEISSFILQHYSENERESTQDALNINDEDMRMLFLLLHEREVTFTDEAQYILKKYFIISRRERPSVFTSKTYIVLKQFAESFAKLALRLEVLIQDIIVAIFHSEHFVQQICGASAIPPPVVTNLRDISQVDAYMNKFASWLFQHLDRYKDEDLDTQHPSTKRRRLSIDI